MANALRNAHLSCAACGKTGHIQEICDVLVNHVLATYYVAKNPHLKDAIKKNFKHLVRRVPRH